MKHLAEWDEQYVLNLPPGEHEWVEFKGSDKLNADNDSLSELSKQLSAFSNSGGGTLIYGIRDAKAGEERYVDKCGVNLAIKRGTKEWLEDIIPNLVEYPLVKFNVYVIPRTGENSALSVDKGVFLIEIPASDHAPHMANDGKYYARVAGKSRPLSHRMVMDIIGRQKYPQVKLELSFIDDALSVLDSAPGLFLKLKYVNVGKIYANYVNGFVSIPTSIAGDMPSNDHKIIRREDGVECKIIEFANLHKDTVAVRPGSPAIPNFMGRGGHPGLAPKPYQVTRFDPLLPGLSRIQRYDMIISASELLPHKDAKIMWRVYADNAPVVEGCSVIGEIPVALPNSDDTPLWNILPGNMD